MVSETNNINVKYIPPVRANALKNTADEGGTPSVKDTADLQCSSAAHINEGVKASELKMLAKAGAGAASLATLGYTLTNQMILTPGSLPNTLAGIAAGAVAGYAGGSSGKISAAITLGVEGAIIGASAGFHILGEMTPGPEALAAAAYGAAIGTVIGGAIGLVAGLQSSRKTATALGTAGGTIAGGLTAYTGRTTGEFAKIGFAFLFEMVTGKGII